MAPQKFLGPSPGELMAPGLSLPISGAAEFILALSSLSVDLTHDLLVSSQRGLWVRLCSLRHLFPFNFYL